MVPFKMVDSPEEDKPGFLNLELEGLIPESEMERLTIVGSLEVQARPPTGWLEPSSA